MTQNTLLLLMLNIKLIHKTTTARCKVQWCDTKLTLQNNDCMVQSPMVWHRIDATSQLLSSYVLMKLRTMKRGNSWGDDGHDWLRSSSPSLSSSLSSSSSSSLCSPVQCTGRRGSPVQCTLSVARAETRTSPWRKGSFPLFIIHASSVAHGISTNITGKGEMV